MIKKLQRKFVLITMGSLLFVIILVVGAINLINFYHMEQQTNETLTFLSENQGNFPDKKDFKGGDFKHDSSLDDKEAPFSTRYFVVNTDTDGKVSTINTGHIAAITSDDAKNYAASVLDNGKNNGYEGIYKYNVVVQSSGKMILFLDCRKEIQNAQELLAITIGVALTTMLLMFLLVSIFSRRAIKPIIEAMEKQKQFITDAGHEIKTPIAIISANAEVLEMINGENEWTTSIRNQTGRLDKLVKNLLMLSKMEEDHVKMVFSDFDLSRVVEETGGLFETMADAQKKHLEMKIQSGLTFHGDESAIQQLVSTLADNALKYSDTDGTIRISLSSSKKGIILEFYNTSDQIDVEKLDKLFERFYRADSSRSRDTGGYGIGLSIAKSIVEAHHGKITARSDDGKSIIFTIKF